MSHLFIVEDLDDEAFVVDAEVLITGDEAHHAVSVRRVREGENVFVSNGRGVISEATVSAVRHKELSCVIESVRSAPKPKPQIGLVQALAKGDRDERAVQAATEVGVDAIYPYQANRSITRWSGDKEEKARSRWQKLAREAAKQSLRARVPQVYSALKLPQLELLAGTSTMLVLEPSAALALSNIEATELTSAELITLVVGPEGGFDSAELQALVAAGARLVRLGDTVLRTSTAGVAALSVLNLQLRRW
jgi:16S rRNA (uracil1498-N3)-methyltransferase